MPDAIVERDGQMMIITLNRPKRFNALTGAMLARSYDAMVEASADPDIRCIILTGAGGNFCAGADLRAMAGDADDTDGEIDIAARMKADPDLAWKGLLRSYRPTKPIICAVEGVAIAGGTEILQAHDIRVAGEGATFGIAEVRRGLFPLGGSTVRLSRQIPYTIAADLLLTGRSITAGEAKDIGLIGHVVPDGGALDKAREIAEQIGENGPLAVQAVLKSLRTTREMPEKVGLAYELEVGGPIFLTEDAMEGPTAFAQKRKPEFKGR